jgi:type VI secretion system protein ImpA
MASPETLDFNKLLAPLAGDKPTGVDLRADHSPQSVYYLIKDARGKARLAERQLLLGEEVAAENQPDWRPVLQHGTQALLTKTHDLEITAYVIEALVRRHGFAGLRDGFRLAREYIEQYWDTLYPLPNEEDGLEGRLAAITGLNGEESEGTLIAPIARVPLTENTSEGQLAAMHYQEALALAKITDPKLREKKIAGGTKTLDAFQKAVTETPAEFYAKLHDDLMQCKAEYTKLCAVLDQKCGPQAPPSSNIRTALESCLEVLNATAKAKLAAAAPPAPEKEEKPTAAPAGAPAAAKPVAPPGETLDVIRNREDAFRAILKVADFFRRTEPHTIVSFALEQVVRWGRMSLPELLTELIPEEAQRKNLFKQVGIRAPEPPAKAAEAAKK